MARSFAVKAWLMGLALAVAGCTRDEAELAQIFEARSPRPAGSETALRQRVRRPAGENPFGLPSRPLSAGLGDFVLAPSSAALEQAFEQGADAQTFIYYGAIIQELGPLETTVRFLTHERRTLPNALLVPIRRGALASPGDVLLTSRASGAGMVRAIAIGGEPATPRVKYLDPPVRSELDAPLRAELLPGTLEDILPRDRFHVLREAGEPGSTVACTGEAETEPAILLKQIDDRRLVLGFAGRLRVFPAASCRPLPIALSLSTGQKVRFPLLDGFSEGTVQRVDPANGRVSVQFQRAGEAREMSIGVGNLELVGAPVPGTR
jgi:hypothetical protein